MNPRAFTGIAPKAVALAGSQSRTTPGLLEVARVLPSGEQTTRKDEPVGPTKDRPLSARRDIPDTERTRFVAAAARVLPSEREDAAVHPVGQDMEDGFLIVRGAVEDADRTANAAGGDLLTVGPGRP